MSTSRVPRCRMDDRRVVASIHKYQVRDKRVTEMVTEHAAVRVENVTVARRVVVTWG